jgi:hypothetical protein
MGDKNFICNIYYVFCYLHFLPFFVFEKVRKIGKPGEKFEFSLLMHEINVLTN